MSLTPRPPSPRDFSGDSVRSYRDPGRSLKSVCADIGISPETLRKWGNIMVAIHARPWTPAPLNSGSCTGGRRRSPDSTSKVR